MEKLVTAEIEKKIGFYDVDSMDITWHGNYIKFLEDARCALLDKLDYDYNRMKASGYGWPIVSLSIKYLKPTRFKQLIKIKASLIEYYNCIKIQYLITDVATGEKISKAETMQMAIDLRNMESCFKSPDELIDKVENYLKEIEVA